jgi:phosphohistidine swiveling domain-containing protein
VLREFASVAGLDVEFFTRGCRRYAIRRYPKTAGVAPAKEGVLAAGLDHSWLPVAVVQAVWDAHATGIIRRSPDGYVIEIAQGHFVPKGVVPTSTLLLDRERRVVSVTWRDQPTCYQFIDGHVVTVTPPEEQLRLDDRTIASIATTFDPLFEVYEDAALEFGMIEDAGELKSYLIDVAEGDVAGLQLDAGLMNSGVLSVGRCAGRVHKVELSPIGALDGHLHDRPDEVAVNGNVVVVAERASVDLLPFVGVPGVVGFVFERGSILAHLAVVLREKGIPAIAVEDGSLLARLTNGTHVGVDAQTRSLSAGERISVGG